MRTLEKKTLSLKNLLALARRNKISAILRCNWQLKYSYDPIVAAYETRRGTRFAIAVFVIVVVVAASLMVLPNALDLSKGRQVIGFACGLLIFCFGAWWSYSNFMRADQKSWGPDHLHATDFPDALATLTLYLFPTLEGATDFTPDNLKQHLTVFIVAVNKEVRRNELKYENMPTIEKKRSFPMKNLVNSRETLKALLGLAHQFSSSQFPLVEKDTRYYNDEAEKQLRREEPELFERKSGVEEFVV